jgi:hypothetical protein
MDREGLPRQQEAERQGAKRRLTAMNCSRLHEHRDYPRTYANITFA